jgi:tRNA A-37 threonylcarbamoyl transferase component Bud32
MVFFEDLRPCDIHLSTVIDGLYGFFPDIGKNDIKFFYHGSYNVFEVKGRYIFRIPDKSLRNQKGVELILNEVKMLHHIRKYVSIKIPEPIYISTDPDCPFMGYEKIKGIPLHKVFIKIPKEKRLKVAANIGKFLTELHSEKLCKDGIEDKIVDNTFSCEKYKSNLEQYFKNIQQSIFQLLDESQKQWIKKLFINFLEKNENFRFNYSIIHGDFDTSNILIDPHKLEVLGIVDFEESRIYDRAADFLFYNEGNNFLQTILKSYKNSIDKNFTERMKFLYKHSCLGYLTYGVSNNLPDLVCWGLKLLEKRMNQFPLI